jgi:glycine cleavage system H protein
MSDPFPDDVLYHPEHGWARPDGGEAALGITSFATDQLGEIVQFQLPEANQQISKDKSYGEVESYKALSELISPVSGTVLEANAAVADDPSSVNADPYGAGWLIRVVLSDPSELEGLLDPAGYREILGND